MRSILFAILIVAAGCGGKSAEPTTPAPAPEGGEHAGHGAEHEHEGGHPELTPEMHAFHDQLAPLWHAEPGPQRQADTCDSIPTLEQGVASIAAAPVPAGVDGATWTGAVGALDTSLDELQTSCAGAEFDATFSTVHDRFHALMDLLPKA